MVFVACGPVGDGGVGGEVRGQLAEEAEPPQVSTPWAREPVQSAHLRAIRARIQAARNSYRIELQIRAPIHPSGSFKQLKFERKTTGRAQNESGE